MKQLIRSLICLSLSVPPALSAQETTVPAVSSPREHFFELGFNLYRLDLPGNPYLYRGSNHIPGKTRHNFFRGMQARYFHGKHILRASLDHSRQESMFPYLLLYPVTPKVRSQTTDLNLGYAWRFLKTRFSPYVFSDLGYTSIRQQGYYYTGDYLQATFIGPPDYHIRTSVFHIYTGLGLRYNPLRSLVLNLETHIQYFFLRESAPPGQRGTLFRQARFHPVQLTLGFII